MGRILIIEDARELANGYNRAMTKAGFKVLVAYDGLEALAKIRNEKFDLIITDLKMPKMSGIDVIECLRKEELESQHRCPIIISSAFIDKMVYDKFKTVGRIHFMPKPVLGKDLVLKVRGLLGKQQQKSSIDVKILNPILTAVKQTISSMTGVSLEVTEMALKTGGQTSGDISGIVSVLSPCFRGSISISFHEPSFIRLISNFLKIEFKQINDENRDSIIEILNLIFGAARRELQNNGVEMQAAIPSVITGKGHCVDHKFEFPTLAVTFRGEGFGECRVEICSAE